MPDTPAAPTIPKGPLCWRCGHEPHDELSDPRCGQLIGHPPNDIDYCGCVDSDVLWARLVKAEARSTPAEALDVERLAATEWAYDTMPESFDVIRDPVEAWNDWIYPATSHDKSRYRRRAAAVLAHLSRNEEAETLSPSQ